MATRRNRMMETGGELFPCRGYVAVAVRESHLAYRLAADVGAGVPLENTGVALHVLATRLAEAVSSGQRAGHLYAQLDPMPAAWHILDLWHGATERARLERGDGAPKAALAHLEAWLKP